MDLLFRLLWPEIRRIWATHRWWWGLLLVLGVSTFGLLVWLAQGVAAKRFFDGFDQRLTEWSALPIGQAWALFACAVLAWTAAWVVIVLFATFIGALFAIWPQKRLKHSEEERKALEEKVRLIGAERDRLEAEQDRLEIEKEGLRQFNQYGRTWTQMSSPGDGHDQKILTNAAKEVSGELNKAVNWAGKVWGELQGKTYTPAEDSPASMVGERINSVEFEHLKNALVALNHHLSPGRDPRAPLICAYIAYQEWRKQLLRFAASFDQPIEKFADYRRWFDAESEFSKVLGRHAKNTVQFGGVSVAGELYLQENKIDPLPQPES